jgi:hypothetical protein
MNGNYLVNMQRNETLQCMVGERVLELTKYQKYVAYKGFLLVHKLTIKFVFAAHSHLL